MRYDYTSIGFYTFDCLGRPVSELPPPGGTLFIDELTIAVSGAAGSAVIDAAKLGLDCLAVGAVGHDLMGDWVLERIASFGIDTSVMQRSHDYGTSSSIVTTMPDGARPALHMKGATGAVEVTDSMRDQVLDSRVVHIGGTGLLARMDGQPSVALMQEAKRRGCTTTLDVFAVTENELPLVTGLLPHIDYFLPSIEEAQALSGLDDPERAAAFFLDHGAGCVILTLGEDGAYYRHSDGTAFHQPAFDVQVVDTCGCGDAFNAGVAAGLCNGLDARETVALAQATSGLVATGLGSQAGVRAFQETLEMARGHPTRTPSRRIAAA
jgi:sugar/nucleoside kinase (ribokinase family)